MQFTKFALIAALAMGVALPARAQTPAFDTAAVSTGCAVSCAGAAQTALAQITASGVTGAAYDAQIALLASLLYTLAQNGQATGAQVGAALRTVAAASPNPAQQSAILEAAARAEADQAVGTPAPLFEASPN